MKNENIMNMRFLPHYAVVVPSCCRRWITGFCVIFALAGSASCLAAEGEAFTGGENVPAESSGEQYRPDRPDETGLSAGAAETPVTAVPEKTERAEGEPAVETHAVTDTAAGNASPLSPGQIIDRYVLQASAQLPIVLDDMTRLDRISRSGSDTLQYDFSITNAKRADLDEETVRRILAGAANVGCSGHEQLFSQGIRIEYNYAVEGAPIGAVTIDAQTCSRKPLSQDDAVIRVLNPGKSPASLAERIQRYVARDSVGLPLMVDKMTRLDRVEPSSDGNSLNYYLTIMNIGREEVSARLVRINLQSTSDGACNTFAALIREGGKVRYFLNLEDGPAGMLEVDQALCARQPVRLDDPALVTINVPDVPKNLGVMINRHVEEASIGLPQMMSDVLRLDRVQRAGDTMIQHDVTVMHDDQHPVDRNSLRAMMLELIAPGCRAYEWFIAAGVRVKVDYSMDGERAGTLLLDQAVCERLPVSEDDPAAVVFK